MRFLRTCFGECVQKVTTVKFIAISYSIAYEITKKVVCYVVYMESYRKTLYLMRELSHARVCLVQSGSSVFSTEIKPF